MPLLENLGFRVVNERTYRVISTDLLLALLGGAIAGGGLLLLVAALVGWAPRDRPGPSLADRPA